MNIDNDFIFLYTEKCKKKISDEIELTTRFDNNNLKIKEIIHEISEFQILLNHEIDIRTHVYSIEGITSNYDDDDFFSRDSLEFKREVYDQEESEKNNNTTKTDLINFIKDNNYGEISTEKLIYENSRKLHYTFPCSVCSGKGTVKCPTCKGTGKVECTSCNGRGYHSKNVRTVYSDGTVTNKTVNETCWSCSNGKVTCKTCEGNKVVMCNNCGGTGSFTKIATTQVYTTPVFTAEYRDDTPEYVKDIVANIHGEPNLKNICFIELEEISSVGQKIQVKYNIKLLSFKALLNINGKDVSWILYGNEDLLIYDTDGFFEFILQDDLNNLKDIKWYSKLNPFFKNRAKKILVPFMDSEVHQDLLAASVKNPSASLSQLKNSIEQKLQQNYIKDTLTSLSKILNIVNNWSILKYILSLSIFSFVLFYFGSNLEKFKDFKILLEKSNIKSIGFLLFIAISFFAFISFLFLKNMQKRYLIKSGNNILYKWGMISKKIAPSPWLILFVSLLNTALILTTILDYPKVFNLEFKPVAKSIVKPATKPSTKPAAKPSAKSTSKVNTTPNTLSKNKVVETQKKQKKLSYNIDNVYTRLLWKGYSGKDALENFKKDNNISEKGVNEKVLTALGLEVKYE